MAGTMPLAVILSAAKDLNPYSYARC